MHWRGRASVFGSGREILARIAGHVGAVAASILSVKGIAREIAAGSIAALVTIAQCISFSALVFAGPLADGLPRGLWAFMAGSAVATVLVALTTALSPALSGPRNPAIAVMGVLAGGITAAVAAAGGDPAAAADHLLLALALATLATGLVLWLIGRFQLGQAIRYIPYPVIAGFLGASGLLLVLGGLKVALGRPMPWPGQDTGLSTAEILRAGLALAFALAVMLLRRRMGAALLPVLVIGAAAGLDLVLLTAGTREGWTLAGGGVAAPWSPLGLVLQPGIAWPVLGSVAIEIVAVVGVTVVALMLDVSSLEVQRRTSVDADEEFRRNGAANLVLAPFGGIAAGIAPNVSRLADELGARTRLAGVAGGLAIGLVLAAGIDVARFVPTPVLGGLLIALGLGVMADVLLRQPGGRTGLEAALALLILVAIVRFGYLEGLVLGLIGASLLFALSYSRIGVIRRHATRAAFASPVERAPARMALLAAEGGRIHVFWLSGFVFFGSANGALEAIRRAVTAAPAGRPTWVVLDLGAVSGINSSAVVSFAKLETWAREQAVTIHIAGLVPELAGGLAKAGVLAGEGTRIFATRADALARAEEELLDEALPESDVPRAGVAGEIADCERWLADELGAAPARRLVDGYLQRREFADGAILCHQGEPSETLDLVAAGGAAVVFRDAAGRDIPVRRMLGRTVIGEMGFFRGAPRAASVTAIGPTVVLSLTRARYALLQLEEPAVAATFLELIVRSLADRVEFANREISTLS